MIQISTILLLSLIAACTKLEGRSTTKYELSIEDYNLMDINFKEFNTVHFKISRARLNGTVHLMKLDSIVLIGQETTIKCSNNSGIVASDVNSIEVISVIFVNCGIVHTYHHDSKLISSFQSALYFFKVLKVTLNHLLVNESVGTGLVLLNCKQVRISNSIFSSNKWDADWSFNKSLDVAGGGGIHVDISCSDHVLNNFESVGYCKHTSIEIVNCSFIKNLAKNLTIPSPKDFGDQVFTSFGKGGGLALHIRDNSYNNSLNVRNCTFIENFSKYGGGAIIVFSNAVNSTKILMINCTFLKNKAHISSGGLDIGYVGEGINNNNITISLTDFIDNSAQSGGAIAFFFLYSSIYELSSIVFSGVQWINNSAHYGAVLFASPLLPDKRSLEPRVLFQNTSFINNSVFSISGSSGLTSLGEGIIMTNRQNLEFERYVLFQGNNASCIYSTSSAVYFSNIDAKFIENSGLYGAGLALIGYSSINLGENTTLTFCNNTVAFLGSAIYHHSIDKSSYIYSISFCFIQLPSFKHSLKIYLYGNRANDSARQLHGNISSVIYANTYSSCILNDFQQLYERNIITWSDYCLPCHLNPLTENNNKNFIACHSFDNSSLKNDSHTICHSGIGSEENNIILNRTDIDFIPGIQIRLPIRISSYLSDLCGSLVTTNQSFFFVSVKNYEGSNITSVRTNINTRSISRFLMRGVPGNKGALILTETSFRKLQVLINVTASECPPLFYLDSNNECKCLRNKDIPYPEFHSCTLEEAKVRMGFWVGYENCSGKFCTSSLSLLISHCPPGFCTKDEVINNYISLPQTRGVNIISNIICNNREGRLCGLCKENFAVYFHAKSFECRDTKHCHLGLVLYFLSEIVPLTLLFFVLIFFDIRLTAGHLNGFVFFAQTYNSVTLVGEAFVKKSSQYHMVSAFHRIVYMFFDFDFFSVEKLSFCLFNTRSALNVVIFKYVTVVYALLLVIGTVWFLNKFGTKLKCIGIRQFKYSALQGLSAFLVIVYSQCTQVSFRILNFAKIYKDDNSSQYVPFLQGNIDYFGSKHLLYAIPAILCVIIVVVALPVLLIFYPLSQKLSVLQKIENSRFSRLVSIVFPLSKLKPLLDSLQGCFKDDFRFFAGFYFIYRIIIIATILQERIEWIHTAIEIVLVCITGLHVLTWPYQKRLHNIIDGLLFCNLSLIVILKRFTFIIAEKGNKFEKEIGMLHLFQLFFINAPLAIIFCRIVHYTIRKCSHFIKRHRKKKDKNNNDPLYLDDSILNDDARRMSIQESYMRMVERRSESLENTTDNF